MSFNRKILDKAEQVRNGYIFDMDIEEDHEEVQLTDAELILFCSMERFHHLGHVRYCKYYEKHHFIIISARKSGNHISQVSRKGWV